MKVLGWLTWFGGFFAGIILAIKPLGYSRTDFSVGMAFLYWTVALITGCVFYSIGMILDNQEKIIKSLQGDQDQNKA